MPLSSNEREALIRRLIIREGGYANNPKDPGGETKYGISKRSYPDEDIKNLTPQRARDLYVRDVYERHGLDRFRDRQVIEWILDWLVHSGTGAVRSLQRQLRLTVDGVIGPATIAAVDALKDPKDILRYRLKFLVSLTGHYAIGGWVNRLIDLGL